MESAELQVDTDEAKISSVTTEREIEELPLQGRDVFNLANQAPGVTGTGLMGTPAQNQDIFQDTTTPAVVANGAPNHSNTYLLDGISLDDSPSGGDSKLVPSPDALQSVVVSTSDYSAQFGKAASLVMQMTTKAGTNKFHGSAFEAYQSSGLTARRFTDNFKIAAFGNNYLPPLTRNEFGGSFGGPIFKDRTFFFATYDQVISQTSNDGQVQFEDPAFVAFEGQNYFRNPGLLEFIAENPVRHNTLPANIVEMTKIILDAGARYDRGSLQETLMLVATGGVARETGHQRPLMNLLVAYGADPNQALRIALVLRELDSAQHLIGLGAVLDLPAAASLGRTEDVRRLLPGAGNQDRHLALSQAAQFGHAQIVRLLLEAGEAPNRYNPPGGHSHATPLHQAAAFGHLDVARLLVQHGARVDMKDTLWRAIPAEWAQHGNQPEVQSYLLAVADGRDRVPD